MDNNQYEYLGRRDHGPIIGRESRSSWQLAALHRAQILRMLPRGEKRRGTLCVFGVGDGSALDLAAFLDRFHEVHLVDEDSAAIEAAIRSQDLREAHRIFRRDQVDIGGVSDLLKRYAEAPSESLHQQMVERIRSHRIPDLGQFDYVLSSSVLTRLTRAVAGCFGDDVENMVGPLFYIRHRHVELLMDHARPGGEVFLVTDFVSSETVPELAHAPANLMDDCARAVKDNNFYPGVNPAMLEQLVRTRAEFRDRLDAVQSTQPWLLEEADRFSACVGIRLCMGPATGPEPSADSQTR